MLRYSAEACCQLNDRYLQTSARKGPRPLLPSSKYRGRKEKEVNTHRAIGIMAQSGLPFDATLNAKDHVKAQEAGVTAGTTKTGNDNIVIKVIETCPQGGVIFPK